MKLVTVSERHNTTIAKIIKNIKYADNGSIVRYKVFFIASSFSQSMELTIKKHLH